ncbi:MAG: hypothetical protein H5U10_17360 [Desulfacinum sp.]|nr:hypothetical protein [Desulfacinum sp.]
MKGQMLIQPLLELEGWWMSLSLDEAQVIALHDKRGPREQFQSEVKSDLDLKGLRSGKFATNALVLSRGGFAHNILRILGQNGILGEVFAGSPSGEAQTSKDGEPGADLPGGPSDSNRPPVEASVRKALSGFLRFSQSIS